MTVVFRGIDLAKNVFALHGVDAAGKPCLVRPQVRRDQLTELIAKLPPCTIAMEACSGAHHWARTFSAFGHTVKLIAPRFVIPFRMGGKRGKNDQADAAAICEAMQRPAMRFVPVKSVDAQSMLALHATRQGFVQARTATINRLRGLLSEFGIGPTIASALRASIGGGHDFDNGGQLASWLGLVPGQYSSGGKNRPSDTGQANATPRPPFVSMSSRP